MTHADHLTEQSTYGDISNHGFCVVLSDSFPIQGLEEEVDAYSLRSLQRSLYVLILDLAPESKICPSRMVIGARAPRYLSPHPGMFAVNSFPHEGTASRRPVKERSYQGGADGQSLW